jgi:cobalt-zinc-cadmium efflux system membrane fusion protein
LFACSSGDTPPPSPVEPDDAGALRIQLNASVLEEFDIGVETAAPGTLRVTVSFPGEVKVNQDRFAHIVPRVSGFVHTAGVSVGDRVRAGQPLAVLDSRELADIKADYLANLERQVLAEATHKREERLFQKKISSEQEYLEARKVLAEARIALRSSRQKLLALGFAESYIASLPEQPEHALVHYELTAPITGVVIEKHISQGESLTSDAEAFSIADLRTVWVDLNVFQKDLDLVREGQQVTIVSTGGQLRASGTIAFIRPIVGEETRTAMARIVLENSEDRWRPGLFVSGTIIVEAIEVPLIVPKAALISMDGQIVIFVQLDDGFEAQPVTIGRQNETHTEITAGLEPGMRYVVRGGFALKAELEKGELGEGHAH